MWSCCVRSGLVLRYGGGCCQCVEGARQVADVVAMLPENMSFHRSIGVDLVVVVVSARSPTSCGCRCDAA